MFLTEQVKSYLVLILLRNNLTCQTDFLFFRNIVLVAVKDDGHLLSKEAIASLQKYGGHNITHDEYRSSYALIGWTGPGSFEAVTQASN